MNPIERAIRRVDAAQQRHKAPAFVVGVIKKYGDDNGGVLAASLAHSGFVSLFPLLLVLVTILGLVASGDPALRHEVLNAVARQVPLIGHQLAGNVHQLRRCSVIGLAAGLLALTWERQGSRRRACSRWRRSGTCRGLHGPATRSGSGAPGCSWACSGSA